MNNLRLYQYGEFVIPFENLEVERELGIRSKLDNSDYYDGQIRTNSYNKDRTEDTLYKINFTSLDYSYDQLDKLFYSKPQKIFFIEKVEKKDYSIDYKVYFAYASLYSSSKKTLECDQKTINYEITIRQIGRRFMIEDNRLIFIKTQDLNASNNLWEQSDNFNWEQNDNINWEDQYNGKSIIFNQQNIELKANLFDCCSNLGIFDYKDLYFKQEVIKIDLTANNYIDINLVVNDALLSPLVLPTRQSNNMLNLNSTADNTSVIFEIKKDGTLPALGLNQWIEIVNNKDQSGFRITCLNAYCPAELSIFTHKNIKLYNSNTNQAINFVNKQDNQNYLKWKIEKIGTNNNFFELSSNFSLYKYFNTNTEVDDLVIRRNFSGNLTIRIQNLPTFY